MMLRLFAANVLKNMIIKIKFNFFIKIKFFYNSLAFVVREYLINIMVFFDVYLQEKEYQVYSHFH